MLRKVNWIKRSKTLKQSKLTCKSRFARQRLCWRSKETRNWRPTKLILSRHSLWTQISRTMSFRKRRRWHEGIFSGFSTAKVSITCARTLQSRNLISLLRWFRRNRWPSSLDYLLILYTGRSLAASIHCLLIITIWTRCSEQSWSCTAIWRRIL